MTLTEFNRLNEFQQAEFLLDHGVKVAERIYKDFTIFLYQVNLFYVEVYFHNLFNIIQGFKGFDNITVLDPYLETIDITELGFAEPA
jgi:hypothetical protein